MGRNYWFSLLFVGMTLGHYIFIEAADSRHPDPFHERKVVLQWGNSEMQLAMAKSQSQVRPKSTVLPADFELSVLYDSECVGDNASFGLDKVAKTVRLKQSLTVEQLEAWADHDPCVLGVSNELQVRVNGEFTLDPRAANQTYLGAIAADSGYEVFWGSSLRIERDVVIAVIDSGVDYNHSDLAARMWRGSANEVGYDFANNDSNPMDDNTPGHGTHVAGLIGAASNNSIGISGTMGFRSKIMAVKAIAGDGSGTISDVVNGIRYAVDNGADIINMSLGGAGASAVLEQALAEAVAAGVVVIVAAGNENDEITATNVYSPASYGALIDGVVTVGSFDSDSFARSSFSNYSQQYVEIMAPGSQANSQVGILSTLRGNVYGGLRGTSMATPIVAGAVGLAIGLLKTHGVNHSPASIEETLRRGSIESAALQTAAQNGRRLHLGLLAKELIQSYLFMGSMGLESE